MAKKASSYLGYIISLLVGGILLYLVFKNISFEEFLAKAEQADYRWVFLSIGITVIAHVIRSYRWTLLINPLGYQTTTLRTTVAVLIGYLANLVLPRLGEVTRCGVLKKTDEVPITLSLGTVISERLIDLLSLVLLIFLTLFVEFDKLTAFLGDFSKIMDTSKLVTMAIGGVVLLIILGIAGYWLYNRLEGKLRVVMHQLIEGLFSLRKVRNKPAFILSTVVLWIIYFFMGYIIFFSIPETSNLGWGAGLMLLVTGGIALTIPVQGGFGTYHTITSSMLLLYSIDKTTGLFVVTLSHSSQVMATVIYGLAAMAATFFLKKKSPAKQGEKV